MYIDSLALNKFRNYDNLDITFSSGTNILYGDNAQGKTNILEAIYLAATTKSHRGSHDKEIIKLGSEEAHIKVNVMKKDIPRKIDMHLRKTKTKGAAIDGLPVRRTADLFGLINIVLFSPEDLGIIKDGPNERRRFIDMELCQLSRIYLSNLAGYNKILGQRNNLLKQIYYDKSLVDTLDIWDEQLISYGNKVIEERDNFIKMMNEIIKDIHKGLTKSNENLIINYEKSTEIDIFHENLIKKRDIDLKYQTTNIGPHRDDMTFSINGMDVKTYGSQGQQRTVALSLKLAEIELVKKIINDSPILLLDDVMSELDGNRRNALLDAIKDIQTIITCTGYDDFIQERLKIDRIYKVSNGTASLRRN